ncbi:STAS domain-containing protein [Streptacidiphilus sp. N1-12]|uniref:STAS domain-containing protein n=2 Tax=Streptacidiphilus alkalitolerans TaxID=3342712 RepID=A0ABV6WPX8_9ACTN
MDLPVAPGRRGPREPAELPCPHGHGAYEQAPLERFGEACVSFFDQGEAHVVILRGELDWRTEHFVQVLMDQARGSGRPLVVDLSAVTHLHIDVLAQLLAARRQPGISLLTPLPPAFLRIADATGTTHAFTLHADLVHAVDWSALRQPAPS